MLRVGYGLRRHILARSAEDWEDEMNAERLAKIETIANVVERFGIHAEHDGFFNPKCPNCQEEDRTNLPCKQESLPTLIKELCAALREARRESELPKISTGGDCETCKSWALAVHQITQDKIRLQAQLHACERTAWIAALRWVLASPSRIWGSGAGKVCVHGIGAFRPCLICREDVILSKITEFEVKP